MRSDSHRTAVLLLAHGTPHSMDEIPEYLRNVTSGRPIPDSVIAEVIHRYRSIERSPLTDITLQQARLLSQSLRLPVYVGMRNWKPYIADVVKQLKSDGVTSAVAICLAPQNSRTSVGLYRAAVEKHSDGIALEFLDSWHDHPLLIAAFAERLEAARNKFGTDAAILFTAHSVPARTIETGDPYDRQTKETANLVAQKIGLADSKWAFAFQSQGMSGGPWIGPTVEAALTRLKEVGHRRVIMQPIGFVCDHIEVLYDIDIGFREFGSKIGLEVMRAESLNDSPAFTAALADIARAGIRRLPPRFIWSRSGGAVLQ